MKTLVAYSSKTGNTRKLAETVFESLPDEKEIHEVSKAPDPAGYDLVAVGFWLMGGKPDPESLQYLSKIDAQKIFLFGTHGVPKNSQEAAASMAFAKQQAPKAQVVGTYSCQGQISPQILEQGKKMPDAPPWLKDASINQGHPDAVDLNELKDIVMQVIQDLT